MKAYTTAQLRNVGVFSHGGAGKTSLVEALLFTSKATNRIGRVDEGNTVSDYDPDEQKRHISVQLAVAPAEWQDCKVNLIDVPGYAEFLGEVAGHGKSAAAVRRAQVLLREHEEAASGRPVGPRTDRRTPRRYALPGRCSRRAKRMCAQSEAMRSRWFARLPATARTTT